MIKCIRISVNCVENDPVDIKCGGPDYLGFDFNVLPQEVPEMMGFIKQSLLKYEVPSLAIYTGGEIEVEEHQVWQKEAIDDCIKNDAEYLQSEHEHRINLWRK